MTDAPGPADKEPAEGSDETIDEAMAEQGVDPDPDDPSEATAPTG